MTAGEPVTCTTTDEGHCSDDHALEGTVTAAVRPDIACGCQGNRSAIVGGGTRYVAAAGISAGKDEIMPTSCTEAVTTTRTARS
jgi:hypothetical protein